MDYYDPRRRRCGRYGSCSTRASALSAAGCWGMYEIARTVQCSWKRCVASRHPAGPGAALYQQSGRCGCALPLQRLCAARHPERKVSGQAWRAVEMGNRLVQLAFGGELTVQYGELLPQPVPWAAIGYDLIVPVPASGKRRGYNVPELMALPLAKAMEVPLAPQALERTRAKRHQAGLPLEQRIANVAGAFRAAQPQQLEGKRILLVDDVITTGTTAAACAQALLHAGADSVFALAFATVEFGAPPDDTTPIHEDDEEDVYRDF